jgi:hypothetical protein
LDCSQGYRYEFHVFLLPILLIKILLLGMYQVLQVCSQCSIWHPISIKINVRGDTAMAFWDNHLQITCFLAQHARAKNNPNTKQCFLFNHSLHTIMRCNNDANQSANQNT